jgi:restriction endonuclease S subunit
MENFIKSRERDAKQLDFSRLEKLPEEIKHSPKIDISCWKHITIRDCFVVKGSSYLSSKNFDIGSIPFLSKSIFNNGIEKMVDSKNSALNPGNCITIGDHSAVAFYQENNFLTSDHLSKLYSNKLNKWNALFVCSVLNANLRGQYSYNRILTKKLLEKAIISLPTKDGILDWDKMEHFTKERYNYFCKMLGV